MTETTAHKVLRQAQQTPERRDAASDRSPAAAPASGHRKAERPRVGWIATSAIVLMLLIGAGWELWRWLLLIITMD